MKLHTLLLAAAVAGATVPASRVAAQESPTAADQLRELQQKIEALEQKLKTLEQGKAPASTPEASTQRIEELDQKVKILERNRELEQEAAEAKAKEAPKITIGEKGFSFTSADTNFSIQLKGLLQVDTRTFFEDGGTAGNDGILLRRARPILQGTVFRDFDFQFVPDFGGSGSPQIYDAFLNYRYRPELQVRAGKYKVPVGLEQLQSDKDTFFTERALPTDLVPNRDLGFMLHGDILDGTLSYAAGLFNGVGDARNSSNVDFDDNKSFAGRLFAQPFKTTSVRPLQGLGFGLSGSYEDLQRGNATGLPNNNGFATPAGQQFFVYRSGVVAEGNHYRLSPQAYYYYGPFGLLGEYVISDQQVSRPGFGSAHLNNTAWQVAAGWILTGEEASFNGVTPRRAFNPKDGGWGAFQLVARYSQLDVDRDAFNTFADSAVSARTAQEYALGLNWYLNRNVRLSTAFSHIDFRGGGGAGTSAPATVTRQDENVLFTRVQLAF